MTGKFVNTGNAHTFNGGSNQGMVTGCGSCNNGSGVPQARGIVGKQSGGGGYGFNGKGFVGKGPFCPTKYQSGGGANPLAPTASDYYNQTTSVGYGYKNGADNRGFAGSGYPKITATTGLNNCQNGGKKKRARTRKHRRVKKRRRTRNRKFSRTRSKNRGGSIRKRGGFICKIHKKKSRMRGGKKKRRRTRKRQRGGYRQFQSDIPLSYTMLTPNGSQGGSWTGQLANPPTFKIVNNCQDNYNHYKQK